jgi:hypothetical protein
MNDQISSAFLLQCPYTYFPHTHTPRALCNLLSTRAEAWVDSRITYGNTSRNIAIILADTPDKLQVYCLRRVLFCSVLLFEQEERITVQKVWRHLLALPPGQWIYYGRCLSQNATEATSCGQQCSTSRHDFGTASYTFSSHLPNMTVLARI